MQYLSITSCGNEMHYTSKRFYSFNSTQKGDQAMARLSLTNTDLFVDPSTHAHTDARTHARIPHACIHACMHGSDRHGMPRHGTARDGTLTPVGACLHARTQARTQAHRHARAHMHTYMQ